MGYPRTMSQPKCAECRERPSIPYQGGRCGPCVRRRHEHLTPALADRLAELAETTGLDLRQTDPITAAHLLGMAAKMKARKAGSWFLSAKHREMATQLVGGLAQQKVDESGEIDPELETLFRRIAHVDRRTGEGPPWKPLP